MMSISRSQFYAFCQNRLSPRNEENQQLAVLIEKLYYQNKKRYGSPRMTSALKDHGWNCGKNRIARIMRKQGLRAYRSPRFIPTTTNSRHSYRVAPNRLADHTVTTINQVWVADITYIRTMEGWMYLSVVMDYFSRRIVGWALQDHMRVELTLESLEKALKNRHPQPGLIHHSDQGTQYASDRYQKLLACHQILPSMSRRGYCYDNAHIESFFGSLKSELNVLSQFESKDQACKEIFKYIEVDYNHTRIHSAIGYQSPIKFEKQLEIRA